MPRAGLLLWLKDGANSGKTLGGSTSINGGAWTRGLNAQYDALSSLLEDSEQSVGWNWDSLFEYMKKVRESLVHARLASPDVTRSAMFTVDLTFDVTRVGRGVLCTQLSAAGEGRAVNRVVPWHVWPRSGYVPRCDVRRTPDEGLR